METADRTGSLARIALLIEYDGSGFNGWQVQNGGRTVQGEIERAVKILTGRACNLTAAGRTDSGVHALGQVAHLDCYSPVRLDRLCIGLSGILDRDVAIKNAYAVPPDFHARFDAVGREYLFLIYNGRQRSPFMLRRAMWVHHPLDVGYLRAAAGHLVGEHDFASFCKKISAGGGTMRRVDSITIDKNDELIAIRIRGNAFLHNMIRIIVGTLCDMHRRGDPPVRMLEILKRRDRDEAGVTAPPYGLYLKNVEYDPALVTFESAY
ncbi:MAG TPA: tRNA pseudouridine(38-40) synthase TruA [Spirochaetota bacterium]|nr:tRNA pseudouridine(38-40) synthase TruA [Spirochaetota bacterium]